ncbi:hypothetical protein MMC24_003082 [Lignoscripta atroalba]|nr:hypothetical protein [Lignoscripta atroalba]
MQQSSTTHKQWAPARFLDESGPSDPYAVLILNQTIENRKLFTKVYHGAVYKVCADGGANRLRTFALENADERIERPDAICGDLDSLRPEIEDYYKQLGTEIEKDPDQYSTDFMKCLKHLNRAIEDNKSTVHDIAVFGGLGGRADQAFAQLHQLYAASGAPDLSRGDIYLITPESIIFLLYEGLNTIQTPVAPERLAENVGIIPMGRPSIITTRGLEWDVRDWSTEFGGQVSTSNHIRSANVEVETTERVLFTVELAEKP